MSRMVRGSLKVAMIASLFATAFTADPVAKLHGSMLCIFCVLFLILDTLEANEHH